MKGFLKTQTNPLIFKRIKLRDRLWSLVVKMGMPSFLLLQLCIAVKVGCVVEKSKLLGFIGQYSDFCHRLA